MFCSEILALFSILAFFLGFRGFEMGLDSTQCESDYCKWNGYEFVELFFSLLTQI